MEWKANFGKALAIATRNSLISEKTTSCGSELYNDIFAIDYAPIIRNWDFRKNAKPKLDGIFALAISRKTKPIFEYIFGLILQSYSVDDVKTKLGLPT